MCGIVGAVGLSQLPTEECRQLRREVLDRLRPRGPDSVGEYPSPSSHASPSGEPLADEPVWLGIRRLAVIDVDGGDQPVFNEDRSVAVVCNGEIYNHVELRRELSDRGHRFTTRSDTEVLAHLYEERGENLCTPLRGMFAFALWDRRRQRLLLARDRFGQKPLYWAHLPSGALPSGAAPPGKILFASEIKALLPLLRAAGVSPTLSEQGLYDYLSLAVVPQPATIWQEIRTLPPATLLTVDKGEIRTRRYWSLERDAPGEPAPSFRRAAGEVRERIAEAVRLRLRSDVPLGVFLSGGLDSSIVAWEAAREVGSDLHTFTVSVEDPELDEAAEAEAFARHLGVRHQLLPLRVAPRDELERLVEVFDQPFADPSALPSLAIARLARQSVTVVLNGDGGDEIFAGYRRYLAARYGESLDRLLGPLLRLAPGSTSSSRRSAAGLLQRLVRGLRLDPGGRYLAWTTDMLREEDKREIWRGSDLRSTESWIESQLRSAGEGAGSEGCERDLSRLAEQRAGDRAVNLLSDLLVKMDMATMAASLEARSPFLDHRLAELAHRLPDRYLVRRGRLKAVLREAYRGLLPAEVLRRKKRGFEIPLATWLAGELAEMVGDLVGSPRARVRAWLDGAAIDDLLAGRRFQDRNHAYLVYSLLVLELWLRRWA